MNTKQRKIIITVTLIYTAFILFFMFLAFGRADKVEQKSTPSFMFTPDGFFRLPSLPNLLHPTPVDVVNIGNIVAFIPFGILIPLLYRTSFLRFMGLFLLSLLLLETVQALTLLGSFDVNDIIQNTTGAAIGFGAYRLGFRTKKVWRNIAATGISAILLMIGVWGSFGIIDKTLIKELGPFVAINELKNSSTHLSKGIKPESVQIGGQNVYPQFNMYGTEETDIVTYTYTLGQKELYFYLNYGILDQDDSDGSLRIFVDGQESLSTFVEAHNDEPGETSIYVQGANELSITLTGDIKIWDVGFREMKYAWNR